MNICRKSSASDLHAFALPEARLYRKAQGRAARLACPGHVLIENRHGLVVDGCVTQATGTAEREAAEAMAKTRRSRSGKRITPGADKGCDARAHIAALREAKITPHVAQNTGGEREIRPSVVFRKVTNGFRSDWGADVHSGYRSLTCTAKLHAHTAIDAVRAITFGRNIAGMERFLPTT